MKIAPQNILSDAFSNITLVKDGTANDANFPNDVSAFANDEVLVFFL